MRILCTREKPTQHLAVDILFHRRGQMHREVLHCDPSKSLELAAGGGEIHFFGGRISQTAEEIKLFLKEEMEL